MSTLQLISFRAQQVVLDDAGTDPPSLPPIPTPPRSCRLCVPRSRRSRLSLTRSSFHSTRRRNRHRARLLARPVPHIQLSRTVLVPSRRSRFHGVHPPFRSRARGKVSSRRASAQYTREVRTSTPSFPRPTPPQAAHRVRAQLDLPVLALAVALSRSCGCGLEPPLVLPHTLSRLCLLSHSHTHTHTHTTSHFSRPHPHPLHTRSPSLPMMT